MLLSSPNVFRYSVYNFVASIELTKYQIRFDCFEVLMFKELKQTFHLAGLRPYMERLPDRFSQTTDSRLVNSISLISKLKSGPCLNMEF